MNSDDLIDHWRVDDSAECEAVEEGSGKVGTQSNASEFDRQVQSSLMTRRLGSFDRVGRWQGNLMNGSSAVDDATDERSRATLRP